MEKKDVMVDLRINRRESGLTNDDLAHLLGVSSDRVSRLQRGRGALSICELFQLSLIFGKTLDQLLLTSSQHVVQLLKRRLADMPDEPTDWRGHSQRLDCLNGLFDRLQTLTKHSDEN